MATIFDGIAYSEKKKLLLKASVDLLREHGVVPHLATILIGDNSASILYVNLKKSFLESLGCQVDIYKLSSKVNFSDVQLLVKTLNEDKTIHGIMIQMPLPAKMQSIKSKVLDTISSDKDVDGLKDNTKFLHPTSKAVMEVLALSVFETRKEIDSVCVVGSDGMVGKPLVKELTKVGYKVTECNKDTINLIEKTITTDVVISATGVMNLITPEMVKNGAIVVDVGSPQGDISSQVVEKVDFITPVPGGVGPVTITCLAENLIISAQSTILDNRDAK